MLVYKKLEEVKREGLGFDISVWEAEIAWCGTVACALGWACKIPELQSLGLQQTECGVPCLDMDGEELLGLAAADELFGITRDQSRNLFMRQYYSKGIRTTPSDVQEKIVALVKSYYPEMVEGL